MTATINTYFAILIVTIAGAAATLLIVHVANANVSNFALGSEAQYAQVQQSILK